MLTMMKKHAAVLAIFSALATGLTASVYFLTKETIEHQAALQQKNLFDQVLPADLYDNDLQNECYIVTDDSLGNGQSHRLYLGKKQGQVNVVAIESVAPDGYSGAIKLLIGADMNGNVYGVRVTEHHETPGLGDKIDIRISDWITHFSGKTVTNAQDSRWAVKKDGGEFDQFTGATITPRAVVKAVKQTVLFLKQHDIATLPRCGEVK
jgi:electron transport complex protein RnfG